MAKQTHNLSEEDLEASYNKLRCPSGDLINPKSYLTDSWLSRLGFYVPPPPAATVKLRTPSPSPGVPCDSHLRLFSTPSSPGTKLPPPQLRSVEEMAEKRFKENMKEWRQSTAFLDDVQECIEQNRDRFFDTGVGRFLKGKVLEWIEQNIDLFSATDVGRSVMGKAYDLGEFDAKKKIYEILDSRYRDFDVVEWGLPPITPPDSETGHH